MRHTLQSHIKVKWQTTAKTNQQKVDAAILTSKKFEELLETETLLIMTKGVNPIGKKIAEP